jgi:ribokinase
MSRVVVIGSINMDIIAKAKRLPKKGETVFGSRLDFLSGGKGANQAVGASRAGAETHMLALGDDESAGTLKDFLDFNGINTSLVKRATGPSGTAFVTVDELLARLEGQMIRMPGHHIEPIDSTGAGDCFCGAFGAALAEGSSPADALKFANTAAAISVTRPGAGPSMPHRDEIETFLKQHPATPSRSA